MESVKNGDKVKVHYHGRLTNGETFDSSAGREPLEFTVGAGQMIKGFDNGVLGMKSGEKKTVEIPSADAYGTRDERMIIRFSNDQLPEGMEPQVGDELMLSDSTGQSFPVVVAGIEDEAVILDANHRLAGEDLVFDIELVEIVPSSRIIMP